MAKTIASIVLVLLVVAILNGYSAEGTGRGNEPKDDRIYKSQKFFGCSFWGQMCYFFHLYCDEYNKYCATSQPPSSPGSSGGSPNIPNPPPIPTPPSIPNPPSSPNIPNPPSPPNNIDLQYTPAESGKP
ncbi:hypothetical protein MtrunA17_Chr8g0340231 [Medicago truncatula]|uniref:RALF-like protein n=1 Tax=Medicago truncatula TaxID=3880 RepID=G7LFW4_MEDTR|nr:mulatexin [Medicago truncatula]AET01460.1 RALF-like protein [Medicago truncatula]RHN39101.1 hypothetical protein MtrunA17_Chr8g0340231 [Medicago truncatula]